MDAYNRLNYLIALLSSDDFPATIENISKESGVYAEQVKKDIEYLLKFEVPKGNPLFKPHISITDLNGEPCYHLNSNAINGRLMLPMSNFEYMFFKYLQSMDYSPSLYDFFVDFQTNIVYIGKNSDFDDSMIEDSMIEITNIINTAIKTGKNIKISSENGVFTMTPHFIKRDINTNKLYVIETYEDDTYLESLLLEDIMSCDIIDDNKKASGTADTEPVSEKTIERINKIWSFDSDVLDTITDEEPFHVKLKIYEDNFVIIDKIKFETGNRIYSSLTGPEKAEKNTTIKAEETTTIKAEETTSTQSSVSAYPYDSVFYYEDDIIGKKPFIEWVSHYGSSIVVLEPVELAQEIYNSLL